MAINASYKFKHAGIMWKSGHLVEFSYSAFEHDPKPLTFVLYSLKGTHPNTGHHWNLVQCINLNYLPRSIRQQFVTQWTTAFNKSKGNMKITWEMIKTQYPYIDHFCRRYLLSPNYYIRSAREISLEDAQKEVVRSLVKDYSKWIMRKVGTIARKIQMGRKR
jgi:hypothetical protein